jgi:hypothetical protein
MNKLYISSLLVVLLAGAQTMRAQDIVDGAEVAEAPEAIEESGAAEQAKIDPGQLLERGKELYSAEKYREARVVFEAVLAEDP